MSDAKFTEWLESFTESDEYKDDSFHWSQMARAAYDQGWHDGDEFQLDCHQDHEKYKLERLRDQFAMAALTTVINKIGWQRLGHNMYSNFEEVSNTSYLIAAAMMSARTKQSE
jgi:hypothetical protein